MRGATDELRRIRVVYLALQAPREGTASHAHVHEIIRGLEKRDVEVELFAPEYPSSGPPVSAWKRLGCLVSAQFRMWRHAKDAHVLYVRSHFAAFPSYLWARYRRLPIIREINGPYQDLFIAWPAAKRLRPILEWMIRAQFRWSDVLIGVTPDLARWAQRESQGVYTVVIPNGANADLFRPGAESVQRLSRPYVIFVGVLAVWQGIDTILEAIDHPEWPKDVRLVVVGEGALQDKVERAATDDRIEYLGKVPYTDVPGLLCGSIGALSPQTDPEGRSATGLFPLKVFEAMACGVPIVVTDYPGQADLVRQTDCGLVVPSGDARALALAVAELASDPERSAEMGSRGRRALEREHSWDARAAATRDVIVETVRGDRSV